MNKKNTPKTYNVERFTAWKRTETEDTVVFGEPVSLAKRLMTTSDSPTVISDDLCGDGEIVASYNANMGGTVQYGFTDLTASDRELFYGEKIVEGTNITTKDDIGSYVVTAHMSNQSGNKVKLTKYMRVLFSPSQEQEQQKTVSGINWATTNLDGKYTPDPETGVIKYVRRNVDPITDKAIIEKWFTEATYHGETESVGE